MKNFWHSLALFTLNQRVPILIVIAVFTAIMLSFTHLELAQDYGKIVPPSDEDFKTYLNFKEEFGEDGNIIAIGVEGNLRNPQFLGDLYDLCENLKHIKGVEGVLSATHLFNIEKDTVEEKFRIVRVMKQRPTSDAEADSLADIIISLPFYQNLIIADSGKSSVIAVSLDSKMLDSGSKIKIFDDLKKHTDIFEKKYNTTLHYAGLPVLRTVLQKILPKELALFLLLAIVVTGIILFIFFRSFSAVFYPILVVIVIIFWALGIQGALGYKLTVIMGIVPALITVVGIPNCVYILTKYHQEYAATGDQKLALMNVIQKLGSVTVMVNATTAVGLGATAVTDIAVLREFGIVAGLTVTAAFFISILLIIIIFSFLPPPSPRHLKHLERKTTDGILNWIDNVVHNHRKWVYAIVFALFASSIWGMYLIEVRAGLSDDVPRGNAMMADMKYMEEKYKGVMPFEIWIDTKEKRGVQKLSVLRDISQLQDSMATYSMISRSLSLADMAKFSRQAFYGGAPIEYDLPSKSEFTMIGLMLKKSKIETGSFSKSLTDSTGQRTRISGNIKDIGSKAMAVVLKDLQADIDSIFNKEKYTIKVTGTTRIYIKGNDYLVTNLIQSLALTLVLIGILMFIQFRNMSGILLSIIPNILPLMMVAGFMGFADIPLKSSTALIFSTVFGISIDNTIHFLSSYRLHKKTGLNVSEAVSKTFETTGLSMIYTSSILFFGFIIFIASSFGGTQSLGYLVGGTLLIALFSNLFFLPAMVLTFGKDKA